jgi:hypothetical protein
MARTPPPADDAPIPRPQEAAPGSEKFLKHLALMMAVNCVRNTVIEDYHADGKLDQSEMKAFNQEVANKLYTFLMFLMERPSAERDVFLAAAALFFPHDWDEPELDRDLLAGIESYKKFR